MLSKKERQTVQEAVDRASEKRGNIVKSQSKSKSKRNVAVRTNRRPKVAFKKRS